eukprot:1387508-Amphidinium_carterae.1
MMRVVICVKACLLASLCKMLAAGNASASLDSIGAFAAGAAMDIHLAMQMSPDLRRRVSDTAPSTKAYAAQTLIHKGSAQSQSTLHEE